MGNLPGQVEPWKHGDDGRWKAPGNALTSDLKRSGNRLGETVPEQQRDGWIREAPRPLKAHSRSFRRYAGMESVLSDLPDPFGQLDPQDACGFLVTNVEKPTSRKVRRDTSYMLGPAKGTWVNMTRPSDCE